LFLAHGDDQILILNGSSISQCDSIFLRVELLHSNTFSVSIVFTNKIFCAGAHIWFGELAFFIQSSLGGEL
jgi:hypothetical protein